MYYAIEQVDESGIGVSLEDFDIVTEWPIILKLGAFRLYLTKEEADKLGREMDFALMDLDNRLEKFDYR